MIYFFEFKDSQKRTFIKKMGIDLEICPTKMEK